MGVTSGPPAGIPQHKARMLDLISVKESYERTNLPVQKTCNSNEIV